MEIILFLILYFVVVFILTYISILLFAKIVEFFVNILDKLLKEE